MAEDAKNRNYRRHYKVIDGQLVPKKTYKTEKEALRAAQSQIPFIGWWHTNAANVRDGI